jgi:hypothetical protein
VGDYFSRRFRVVELREPVSASPVLTRRLEFYPENEPAAPLTGSEPRNLP